MAFTANVPDDDTTEPTFISQIYLRSFLVNSDSDEDETTTDDTADDEATEETTDAEDLETVVSATLDQYLQTNEESGPVIVTQYVYEDTTEYIDILEPAIEKEPEVSEDEKGKHLELTVFMIVIIIGVFVNIFWWYLRRGGLIESTHVLVDQEDGETLSKQTKPGKWDKKRQ